MSNFRIDFVSRSNCENLIVEISYGGPRLCEIDRELVVGEMRICFVDDIFLMP